MTEETIKENKTYDIKIIKWLYAFAKPYRLFMILSFTLMILAAVLELAIPYFTKIAVDSYINPPWAKIYMTEENSEKINEVLARNKSQKISIDKNTYLINLKDLNKTEIMQLERLQAISESRFIVVDPQYYITGERQNLKELLGRRNKIFKRHNDIYYANHNALDSIPASELLTLRKNDIENIVKISIIILSCMLLIFLCTSGFTYILNYSGHKIMHSIRKEVFSHTVSLPQPFFDKNPVGRLTTRLTNDINSINEMYTSVLVQICKDFIIIVGILIVMFYLNQTLTYFMITATLIVGYVAIKFRMRLKNVYRNVRISIARLNAYVQESVSGITLIKLYNREKNNLQRFQEVNQENYSANMDQLFAFATFRPVIELISVFSIGLILWNGGRNVISLNLSLGALIAFLYYVRMLFRPIQELAEKYNIFQSAAAASENLYHLVNEEPEKRIDKKPETEFKGKLEFKNVWFGYTDDKWVLKDISFVIHPGETVALVGLTGSGKTTIVNLILKFYEVNSGQILVDDIDIADYDPLYLRQNISSVFQDTFLIGQNEGVHMMVDQPVSMIKGIRPVSASSNGKHISSGEKQLVSLEKAFSKNANFIILDEATSHIDATLEQSIQDEVKKSKGKKSTLIIAHRLSNVKDADRIIVIHHGEIIEEGPHTELINTDGLYSNLYKLQSDLTSIAGA